MGVLTVRIRIMKECAYEFRTALQANMMLLSNEHIVMSQVDDEALVDVALGRSSAQ